VVKNFGIQSPSDERLPDSQKARFRIGDVVQHALFGYRGVIVDVDPAHVGEDSWAERSSQGRMVGSGPWYHILVHARNHATYVAEKHLHLDATGDPIMHRLLARYFKGFKDGLYLLRSDLH
jgi:heat shock protein HspQ